MRSPKTTGPSVQYCSRGCVTSTLARPAAVGSQGFSPAPARPGLPPAAPLCRQAKCSLYEHQMLEGCAHPLATQDVLGLENTSPQAARGQEGKLLLSSQ